MTFHIDKKILIIHVVCFLIFLVLAVFVIYPVINSIRKISIEANNTKIDLSLFEEKSGNIEKTKEEYSKWAPSIEKAKGMLIDPEIPLDFIKFLEKTTDDCRLSSNISPSYEKGLDSDLWKSMSFQITLAGSFADIMRFVDKIESSPYLIEEKSLNIKGLTKQDVESFQYNQFSIGDVTANLAIKVYTK
jgi:Tfp pilus assembly protein PilO